MALVATSAAAFGGLAIFARVAYRHGADPVTVLAVRFVVAGACMLAVMRVGGHVFPRGRTLLWLVLLGGVGYVTQSLLYFTALRFASAALVALLLYLYPAIVTVLSALFLREHLGPVKIVALVTALGGSALTIGRAAGGSPLGIALGLGAAVAYAIYIVLSSRIAVRAGAIPAATVVILSAAAVLASASAVTGPQLPNAIQGWGALLGLALVSTVVAIVTFFAGLERVGPSEAATISTLEPVVTVLLAATVLSERITVGQVAGGALILAAVLLMAHAGRTRLVPSEAPPT